MSTWAPKRFWTETSVIPEGDGFSVVLDGRSVRTPAKSPFVVPTQALAEACAAEWDAQDGEVRPDTMPMTRTANSAIDKVRLQRAEVADMLAAYGDSDLLCYRADTPAELVKRQAASWDPMLAWAAQTLGAKLEPRTGVIHAAQSLESQQALSARVHQLDAFQLAGFHDLVAISGSLVLGFATYLKAFAPEDVWHMSRVDEMWQEEQWGEDEEAQALAQVKKDGFLQAAKFCEMLARLG
ncbi:MAG: ATP12 family chaperone protein [Maritimibacter sp.]